MIKPDERVLKAILSLESNDDFKVVKGWMEARLTKTALDSCLTPTEPMRTWKQGRVQELAEILKEMKEARDNLNKVK